MERGQSKRRSVLAPDVKRGAIWTVTIFQKRTFVTSVQTDAN
jgi:hypothetical protein